MLSPSKNMKEGSFLIRKGDQAAAAISCSFERKKCLTKEAYLAQNWISKLWNIVK